MKRVPLPDDCEWNESMFTAGHYTEHHTRTISIGKAGAAKERYGQSWLRCVNLSRLKESVRYSWNVELSM